MAPTILIVGATGNTGRGVVDTLPELIKNNQTLSKHRILALTRSASSASAKEIEKLGVELAEQNWVEIDHNWLRQHEVNRIFIASHNEPNQFAEESQFYNEALRAGVEYVVRVSTTAANVRPDYPAYYPRTHWAIEQMLSQPEFEALKWTSLQPNVFSTFILGPAAEFIKEHRKTGKQGTLGLMLSADSPVGIIQPTEIGVVAAHLLAQEDVSKHNKAKLVLNGPEDITGEQVVKMVESYMGEPVKDVKFKDVSGIEQWADSQTAQSKNIIRSITYAPVTAWEGKCKASTTSKEVLEIAAPNVTPAQVMKTLLGE
jgi:uncharacterized protein YbjT (DUF2867 family)